jgi:hypothetical protein
MRGALAKLILRVGFLRRRYVKRLLKHLEEGGGKRGLAPELVQLQGYLKQLPPPQRQQALETALQQGISGQAPTAPEQLPSRSLRRAAEREQRRRSR